MTSAIILAGGLGTRLRPLTDDTPKPLLPIKGKPMVQYAIENLKRYGITDIVLGIGYHADKVQDHFRDGSGLGVHIRYSVESEPLGTGGAVMQALEGIEGRFILLWGDNLMDIDIDAMMEVHERNNAKLTMALTPREDVIYFGVALLKGEKILTFVEKPASEEDAPSNLINAGAFIIEQEALEILPEGKSSIEYDCFEKLTKQGVVYAYIHNGQWFPTDTLEKYQEAEENFVPPE